MVTHGAAGLRQVVCVAALLAALATPLAAQETVVIGGDAPAVEVNEAAVLGLASPYPSPYPYGAGGLGPGIGPDGLQLYDPALGAPRSRLTGLLPEGGRAPAAATTQRIVLRRPSSAAAMPAMPPPEVEVPVMVEAPPPAPVATPPAAEVARMEVEVPPAPTVTPEPEPEVTVMPEPAPVPEPEVTVMPEPVPVPEPVVTVTPEPETEPEPAATPEPEPETTTMAAVAEPVAMPEPATGAALTVAFAAGGAELPAAAESRLREIVAQLADDQALRLQLKAYASAENTVASAARRLSLSRALAVRSFLIDAGVSSTRIDVRALGAKFESGPPDRVDVITVP